MTWLAHQALAAPEGHWDELRGLSLAPTPDGLAPDAQMSRAWQTFIEHLTGEGLQGLNARMANLQRQVRDNGITYNVYAAADQPQRPWSLDLFPLMVPEANWQQIEAGVLQRMQLLERIMADAYGPQKLVLNGQLPAALIQGHPAYLPAMHGVPPVGGRYLSVAAFDLARGPDGCWWLLSQRTQAPSGLGYLLENRLIVSRLFPQAFEAFPVQRLAETYRTLIDGIKARSPAGASAHIALLTPGPYNETYFEHAYLARYLGLSLVQGNDLTVRDEKLYLKTLQGLQPVHGLLRRVDDDWLDPLELRADSTLGVPGLLQAVRSGNVLVANTPGSGFLESNALLGFMPALARDLLGQELQLPAIPSWWCGEAAALQDVLPRISQCVIKPTYPYNTDRHSFEPVLGHQLSRREQDEWAGRILRNPDAYTLQSWLPLSHQPTWQARVDGQTAIESRPVVLRVFAVADAQGGWQVLPGGLARLGTREGIASMQRGGSSADVWVQAASAEAATAPKPEPAMASQAQSSMSQTPSQSQSVSPAPSASVLAQRQRLVTSRAAENLFWMGRYTERTENTLRLVRLSLEILNSENQNQPLLLHFITAMATRHGLVRPGVPAAALSHRVFERSLIAGLWDKQLATSVGFNLRSVRLAAASVRERLSPEHWRLLEQAESRFFNSVASDNAPDTVEVQGLLAETSQMLAALTGAQTDRMTRDDGWQLLSIGRHVERLGFLSSALDLAVEVGAFETKGDEAKGADENSSHYAALLSLFDSTITFQAQYQQSRELAPLIELLVQDNDNPRSLAWVARTLRGRLSKLAKTPMGEPDALARLVPDLKHTDLEQLCASNDAGHHPNLRACLTECMQAAWQVSDAITAHYFSHTDDADSVGA